jgi:uncharacterized protein YggU (UPF0235/DUF167 family)
VLKRRTGLVRGQDSINKTYNIKDMKRNSERISVIIGVSLTVIFCFIILMMPFFRIGHDIKEHISIAQQRYPNAATAEDALIAYLADTTNSPRDRGDIAIWTLGQIHSKKALPVLYKLYKNDPEGKTCHGKHDSVLCQYGINTAIETIEEKYGVVSGPERKK